MTPEVAVRRQIQSWLSNNRIFTFVHDSMGIYDEKMRRYRRSVDRHRIKGVSDVVGVVPLRITADMVGKIVGVFLGVEVKRPRVKDLFGKVIGQGYATPEQKAFLEKVRQLGGIGILARSIEDTRAGLLDYGVVLPAPDPHQTHDVDPGDAIVCPKCHTRIEAGERLRIHPSEQP